MRRNRVMVGLSVAAAASGLMLASAPIAGARSGDDDRAETKRVRVLDDCDPATFNAVLGPGACVGDGDTTFDEFVNQLLTNGFVANKSAPKWINKPGKFHIDEGDRIQAVSKGGEFHTFTEVAEFGGGCVPELNGLLGGLTPVPECDDPLAIPTTALPAGGSLTVEGLEPGVHKFECLIHPWMQSVVEVRADDHDHDHDHDHHH